MAGLLSGVLPYIYSQSDRLKRNVNGLLSDPRGSMEQTAGGLLDAHRGQQNLLAQAFADPGQPFRVTDPAAMEAAAYNMLAGPLGVAPAGMINKSALQAAFPSVDFTLSQTGNRATLSKVVVPKGERGQGVGSDFMNALTKAADEDGATVALSPSSDFGGSKARLLEFYRRFGFAPNKGRNIDYEISEAMYRLPSQTR